MNLCPRVRHFTPLYKVLGPPRIKGVLILAFVGDIVSLFMRFWPPQKIKGMLIIALNVLEQPVRRPRAATKG